MNSKIIRKLKEIGFVSQDYEDKVLVSKIQEKTLTLIVKSNQINIQISNNKKTVFLNAIDYNQISQEQIFTNIKYLNSSLSS